MAAPVRWSASPERVAQQLLAGQPVGFAVRYRHLLKWRRVDFALTPLSELTLMNDQFAPFSEAPARDWLLWQSATGSAVTTSLPCDAAALCQRLALTKLDPQHAATTEALTALVEATWRQGGLPG
jgi:hypothetical protein